MFDSWSTTRKSTRQPAVEGSLKSAEVVVQGCYACHVPDNARDFIFTRLRA
jgi:hypothetical protein